MHFPFGARGNNFDSQIKIIYFWSKWIPFASNGPFCACTKIIKFKGLNHHILCQLTPET